MTALIVWLLLEAVAKVLLASLFVGALILVIVAAGYLAIRRHLADDGIDPEELF